MKKSNFPNSAKRRDECPSLSRIQRQDFCTETAAQLCHHEAELCWKNKEFKFVRVSCFQDRQLHKRLKAFSSAGSAHHNGAIAVGGLEGLLVFLSTNEAEHGFVQKLELVLEHKKKGYVQIPLLLTA